MQLSELFTDAWLLDQQILMASLQDLQIRRSVKSIQAFCSPSWTSCYLQHLAFTADCTILACCSQKTIGIIKLQYSGRCATRPMVGFAIVQPQHHIMNLDKLDEERLLSLRAVCTIIAFCRLNLRADNEVQKCIRHLHCRSNELSCDSSGPTRIVQLVCYRHPASDNSNMLLQ